MKTLIISFALIFISATLFAQSITQTVKGTVIDQATQEGMIGATIVLLGSDPLVGTTTDIDGNFELDRVPMGRHDFEIRMLGYETYQAREILVSSGKEVILEIQMMEDVLNMSEVVVEYTPIRYKAINSMTTLSSQKFTMEETQRFAGGLSDPARMVSAYAGVASPSISSNGISVRGNNPGGLLWRIEGVEVPSPNHFADLNIVGAGALTVLSSQMLGDSDFTTGAFPAEYGNATSGVFDINLRKGNTSRPEYTLQAGLLGLDVALEGPFKSNNEASYLVNYRYSTLGAIGAFLPDDAGILKYQDLSFKISSPTKNVGSFTFWGIGAYDGIDTEALDPEDRVSISDSENSQTSMYLFATGLNQKKLVGSKGVLNSTIAVSGNGLSFDEQSVADDNSIHPVSEVHKDTYKITFQSSLNTFLSSRHINQSGFYLNLLGYGLDLNDTEIAGEVPQNIIDENGLAFQAQFFSQSKLILSEKLSLNAGFHSQYFQINEAFTFEPRMGLEYQISQNNSIAFAYGRHSQAESLPIYFVKDENGNTPNTELDLMKSNHFVFSFTSMLSDNLRLNIEPYLQLIEDVPVVSGSYISTINSREILFFNETLVSEGSARNYGIDVTLERYLHNGLYYLISGSLFDSKYTAQDGIERNTRFNKNFVGNALIGKEWQVGADGNNTLNVNLRLNILGGNRKEAIDKTQSINAQDVVYGEAEERSFTEQHPSTPITSFTFSYRKNKPGYSSVWSLQVLNLSQTKDYETDIFNLKTQKVEPKYTSVMIPNLSWKLEF